ncbi:T9SS type A sorting domain-containing protein [Flavobacterium sp. XGLA_31]|uniref:T9SS type A sorting domain-containing protein n=1 Tax=Flavobacterium sp. XGLA_31 TaxID=3447666 RepID=UPI003F2F89E2
MKKLLLFTFLTLSLTVRSQSLIQSVNSGSIIASGSSVSVGEIVVVPQNQMQSSSGLIGILAQTQAQLEVPQLELSQKIKVFPNPTMASVYFETDNNLTDESISIYNMTGQFVSQKKITNGNSLDLSDLSSGVYLIQFANKNITSFKIIKR